jgi:hypothetical protein
MENWWPPRLIRDHPCNLWLETLQNWQGCFDETNHPVRPTLYKSRSHEFAQKACCPQTKVIAPHPGSFYQNDPTADIDLGGFLVLLMNDD